MGNWKAAFGCALISFILVLITLFGTWYNISGEAETAGISGEVNMDMGLRDMTMSMEAMGFEITNTTSYSDSDFSDLAFVDVFNLTQILVILAMIFALLMFVFALLVGMGKMSSKIGIIFGVLAMVFILIAFIYFMVALPGAMEDDSPAGAGLTGFWGSESLDFFGTSMDVSWGPGWAWYVMVIAFILALIGTIMLFGAEPAPPEPVPTSYPEMPPQPTEMEVAPPMEVPPPPPE